MHKLIDSLQGYFLIIASALGISNATLDMFQLLSGALKNISYLMTIFVSALALIDWLRKNNKKKNGRI
jgi:hypothetical protein